MKKQLFIVGAVLVIFAAAVVFFMQQEAVALNVNDVVANPEAFTGTISITGTMGGVSTQDRTIFGIMDTREAQCTENCEKVYIPVKSQGNIPRVGEEVIVTGAFQKSNQGYQFIAEKITIVKNNKT